MDVILRQEHDTKHDTNEVLVAKGVAMVVLFVSSLICGIIPMLLAKKLKWVQADDAANLKTKNKVVMTLLSFGGGVLLSVTFMHLMPEVTKNVEYLECDGVIRELAFSLTPLLTCCGFFTMYLIEELAHLYIHRREKNNKATDPLVRNLSIRRSKRSIDENGMKSVTNSTADLVDNEYKKDAEHQHVHHSHMPVEAGDNITSALRGLLIVLALSIHELFEGLAVGLESGAHTVWYMLGAIAAHKLVISFCIGVELIATRTKTWLSIIYITTFALITSLGIGIGILLVGGEGATAAGLASVILQGLASGTLLYVIFFEIWKSDRSGMLQYLAALVGFGLMFGIQLAAGHVHSHSHGCDHDGDHDHSHESHEH